MAMLKLTKVNSESFLISILLVIYHLISGLQTSQDARFYELSRKLDKTFNNEGKTLVLQYTVKHEQNIDCGGGYIKLLPADTDLSDFNGDSKYFVMFGKFKGCQDILRVPLILAR